MSGAGNAAQVRREHAPRNFSAGAGWNNNIQTEFYLFVYREGWTDLGFSSIYCNEEAMPHHSQIVPKLF